MHQPDIIDFRRIRNVPEILNVTFDFIRQNFRLLWRSLLFLAFPPIVVGVTVFSYFFMAVVEAGLRTTSSSFSETVFSFLTAVLIGAVLCGVGGTILIGLIHVFVALYRERGPNGFTVDDVWQGTKKIFRMLFLTLIGLELLATVIGTFSLIVPFGQIGLYVGSTFAALYFPLRIYERRGFLQSMILSSKLIEKRWWATFGMFWLFYLLMLGLTGIFMVPIYVVAWAGQTKLIDLQGLVDSVWILRLVGTALISAYLTGLILVGVVPFLSLIFHYYSQRERKEGLALLEQLEPPGGKPSENIPPL